MVAAVGGPGPEGAVVLDAAGDSDARLKGDPESGEGKRRRRSAVAHRMVHGKC